MNQQTIATAITLTGIGLHKGQPVTMHLKPGQIDSGIIFVRTDLTPAVNITITPDNIKEAVMCTLLVKPDDHSISVSTIEHLMSALSIFEIDNLIVEVDAAELPVMDGSAREFVRALDRVGIKKQDQPRRLIRVIKPVRVEEGDKYAEVLPADQTAYRFEIQWDHPVIAATPSAIEFIKGKEDYVDKISAARTFGFVAELDYLHANNLAKGASLDNAVGITDKGVMNPEGLRFEDEFVAHKLLDAIGDFYVGGAIIGRFNCYKSSHSLNNRLLRALFSQTDSFEVIH
ncbi:MAG: UDP-3-O-acyl-N-acetylglucosamine deacetylase [Francisellaceae bacterium]